MNEKELLFVVLMEEMNETSQRVSKLLRFGSDEIQEGQELTNIERLKYEFNDILATMEFIAYKGYFPIDYVDSDAIAKKKVKLYKYLEYSKSLKIVEEAKEDLGVLPAQIPDVLNKAIEKSVPLKKADEPNEPWDLRVAYCANCKDDTNQIVELDMKRWIPEDEDHFEHAWFCQRCGNKIENI